MTTLSTVISDEAKNIQNEIVNWRRDLHRIPEVGFELHKTSAYVVDRLNEMGIRHYMCARTGVVGIIEGAKPGKTIALRADMDALLIKEETGLDFASDYDCMHACGHDAHTAILLGAAKMLNDYRDKFAGNVKLIFEPAEEGEGGAEIMIKEGCLKDPDVDAIAGLHIGRLLPEVGDGQIGICSGSIMAASEAFEVVITGKKTHIATPHLGVDAIVIAAETILALQKIVCRETDPLSQVILSIGKIAGGESINVVADEVRFSGDLRVLNKEDIPALIERIREVCTNVALAGKAKAELKILGSFPAVVNDAGITELLKDASEKIVGKDNTITINRPSMGNDDIGYFLKAVPGTFFILGADAPGKGENYPHHSPKFDINEDTFWIGTAVLTQLVLDFLEKH